MKEREENEGIQDYTLLGATAAEGEGANEEEAKDETTAGSSVSVDDRSHGAGTSSNGQDKGQGEKPIPGGTTGLQVLPSPSGQLPRNRYRLGSSGQDKGQEEELIPGATKGLRVLPSPSGQLFRNRYRFTEFQLQELERIFERNHYPSAAAR